MLTCMSPEQSDRVVGSNGLDQDCTTYDHSVESRESEDCDAHFFSFLDPDSDALGPEDRSSTLSVLLQESRLSMDEAGGFTVARAEADMAFEMQQSHATHSSRASGRWKGTIAEALTKTAVTSYMAPKGHAASGANGPSRRMSFASMFGRKLDASAPDDSRDFAGLGPQPFAGMHPPPPRPSMHLLGLPPFEESQRFDRRSPSRWLQLLRKSKIPDIDQSSERAHSTAQRPARSKSEPEFNTSGLGRFTARAKSEQPEFNTGGLGLSSARMTASPSWEGTGRNRDTRNSRNTSKSFRNTRDHHAAYMDNQVAGEYSQGRIGIETRRNSQMAVRI